MSATYAPFLMERFEIEEFHFNSNSTKLRDEIELDFAIKGTYNQKDSTFGIHLTFIAKESNKICDNVKLDSIIYATVKGIFKFKDWKSMEEIEPYFYPNAIGILFPYLRSYITNATINSDDAVILPLLNLSSLVPDLKNNIVHI